MEQRNEHSYDDIIDLPAHVSSTRRRMTMHERAAQFSSFAALVGYEAAIGETARLTDRRAEISEDLKNKINRRLQIISSRTDEHPEVSITFFRPDGRKSGGSYETKSGAVRRIDECALSVIFTDGDIISINDIYDIEGEIFRLIDSEEDI